MAKQNTDRMKRIHGLLNRPSDLSDDGLALIADPRGINYILQRTEGRTLMDAHNLFLENPIVRGISLNKIVDGNGLEIPRDVALIDSGCACGEDTLGISFGALMYDSRETRYNSIFHGGTNHRRTISHLDIPTLLTYGPIFQGIELEGGYCSHSNLVKRGVLSSEEVHELVYGKTSVMPLENQVEFLTRRILGLYGLQLTPNQAANFHVIPTRSSGNA